MHKVYKGKCYEKKIENSLSPNYKAKMNAKCLLHVLKLFLEVIDPLIF